MICSNTTSNYNRWCIRRCASKSPKTLLLINEEIHGLHYNVFRFRVDQNRIPTTVCDCMYGNFQKMLYLHRI